MLKKSLEKIGIVLEVKTLNDYTFIDQTSSSMKFKENIQIRTIEKLENLLRKAIQPNNTSQPIKGLYDIPTSLYCLGSLLIELKVMDSLSYDHSFDLSIGKCFYSHMATSLNLVLSLLRIDERLSYI